MNGSNGQRETNRQDKYLCSYQGLNLVLLWPVSNERCDFGQEVGKDGESPAHVEDDEHPTPIRRAEDVSITNL